MRSSKFGRATGTSGRSIFVRSRWPKSSSAPLDLAHAVEIVVDERAVLAAERALQRVRFGEHHVEQALVVAGDRAALRVALAAAEDLLERLARLELHRQRRRRRAERDRAAVAAAVGAVARGAAAFLFGRDLERGQRRFLADVARGDLVDRDAAERRMALPRVLGTTARSPARSRARPSSRRACCRGR